MDPPKTYEMQVQVFGCISSPTICNHALIRAAQDEANEFAGAADRIQTNFYVDNYLDSFDEETEAVKLAHDITTLLDRGGFRLTKWLATSRKLLASFPLDRLGKPDLNLERDELPIEKTLGLYWDAERDSLLIKPGNPSTQLTQRHLLSAINKIYDPLGFIQPVFLKAKRILQKSQIDGLKWDDPLPRKLAERWTRWVDALPALSEVIIPRCLQPNGIASRAQLHTFCDASEKGFGCVIYLRTETSNGVATAFIAGKAWTAPKKFLTIPKLELQAAVMGLRLTKVVKSDLRILVGPPTFWSDSATVLGWIQSESYRFQTFVGN